MRACRWSSETVLPFVQPPLSARSSKRTSTTKLASVVSGGDQTRPKVEVGPPIVWYVFVSVPGTCGPESKAVQFAPLFQERAASIAQSLLSVDLASYCTVIPSMIDPAGMVNPKLE